MKVSIFFILMSLLFVACASVDKTVMPNGQAGYSIDCSGSAVSMNVCYEKAGELCPTGYDIHIQDKSGGWIATSTFAGSTSLKGILVTCKERSPASEKALDQFYLWGK